MTSFKKDIIISKLRERVKDYRLEHCFAVAREAAAIAEIFGEDTLKAEIAGLLHDYARDIPGKQLLSIAKRQGLIIHEVERKVPILLHGPVGAILVRQDFRIEDESILEAIAFHTTGAPDMSFLSKIVYLGDIIEPTREFNAGEIRRLLHKNIDLAVIKAMDFSLEYCIKKRFIIHPRTVEARNVLLSP